MSTDLFDTEYLKKLEYLELIARRLVFGRQQAQRLSVRKGASIEFKDFREYTPGDDPRTIDWSVYARLGEVVVKLVPRPSFGSADQNEIRLTIKKTISPTINVTFEVVKSIDRDQNGKYRPVVSEIEGRR